MTNSNNFAENTIVAFHIGRGGRFNNAGFRSFIGERRIGEFTNDLFETYENAYTVGKKIDGRPNLQAKLEMALNDDTDALAFFEKIGLSLGDKCYADAGGSLVGLMEWEFISGVGRIDIDGYYNTTYTCLLSNCNEEEFRLIADFDGYIGANIRDYAKEQLGIVDEEETEQ